MTLSRKILFAVALALAAAPAAAKRPLNPRYRPKTPRKAALVKPAEPASRLKTRLAPGRWDPKVREALELFAETQGSVSPEYDPEHPPTAVLPLDDAFVDGDLGELAFWRQVRRADFKFDDEFWSVVPVAYGRQKIRAAYEQFSAVSRAIWDAQPTYHQYCKWFVESYRGVCDKVGRKECRTYLARLWRGFPQDEAQVYAAQTWDEEAKRMPSWDDVPESPEDRAPARVRRGLRVAPELLDLVRFLRANGVEVWLISSEQEYLVKAAAAKVGIEPAKAAGIRLSSFKEKLNDEVLQPLPVRAGKVETLVRASGRTPDLVVGSGPDDVALLVYGNGLRVVLDSGEPHLRALALKSGWKVQPAFSQPPED